MEIIGVRLGNEVELIPSKEKEPRKDERKNSQQKAETEKAKGRTLAIVKAGYPNKGKDISREEATIIFATLADYALKQNKKIDITRWGPKEGGILATVGDGTEIKNLEEGLKYEALKEKNYIC